MFDFWQEEWDEYPQNKFFGILPKLNESLNCSTRREEVVLSLMIAYYGQFV